MNKLGFGFLRLPVKKGCPADQPFHRHPLYRLRILPEKLSKTNLYSRLF